VQIQGTFVQSSTGQPTLLAENFKLLAACHRQIPWQWGFGEEQGKRSALRHVDLMINSRSAQRFVMRSKIIQWIRSWLHSKEFLQVETPILSPRRSGGAFQWS
jgi:lysyl-tRNA synthetase class 2